MGFYQHFLNLCSDDTFKDCSFWLETSHFSSTFNTTNIALIPKGNNQTTIRDWRPIALCNVLNTVKADMARGASVYPPTIRSTHHVDFSYHCSIRKLLICCQVSLSLSRSSGWVPTLSCHMTWLSAIVAIKRLSKVILWWLWSWDLLWVPILILIGILICKSLSLRRFAALPKFVQGRLTTVSPPG